MSDTTFLRGTSNTDLIPQKWSPKLFKYSYAQNLFKPYMGTDSNSIFQVQKDFLKDKGDKMTVALRAMLTGTGQGDNGTYEDNEEALTFYDMDYQIHERGHSVRKQGNMTDQSSIFNLRQEAMLSLGDWLAMKQASDMVAALSGLSNMTFAGQVDGSEDSTVDTVNQTALQTKSATSARCFFGGQTVGGDLSRVADDAAISTAADYLFGTKVITTIKRMAEQTFDYSDGSLISPIRPVMVDGEKYYVLFIHPLQAKALKNETAWLTAQRDANIRGKSNPIFTGALGVFDGVIIKETPWIHIRTGEGGSTASEQFESDDDVPNGITVARGILCGAQSAVVGYGKMPTWVEEKFDYNTQLGVHTDTIYGIKKTIFDSQEFGAITVDTAVETD